MNEKFPPEEKLKSKILIDRLFTEGRSLQNFPVKLIYLPITDRKLKFHKTGVTVPKRNFKRAVDRNDLKRLLREAYRKNKYLVANTLQDKFTFMFIYTGRKKLSYRQVSTSIEWLLKKFLEKEYAHEKKND